MSPMFDDVYAEVHGTLDSVQREVYGVAPRKSRPKRDAGRIMPGQVPPRSTYEVTADARMLCDCGHYVYTERHDSGPPAFPAACWFCAAPIPTATEGKVT